MSKKSFERKMAFSKASVESFERFEKSNPASFDEDDAGNWAATKLASIMLGLNIIDILDIYESIIDDDLPEPVREAVLLTSIHEFALSSIIDVFKNALPLIGTSGEEFEDAMRELGDELLEDVFKDDFDKPSCFESKSVEPDWDDIPDDIMQMVAEETGISVEDMKSKYSFKAVDMASGKVLDKEKLAMMNADNTVIGGTKIVGEENDEYRIDDQESALDDFLKGFE